MLVIGGRSQPGSPVRAVEQSPVAPSPVTTDPQPSIADPVEAEINRAVSSYQAGLLREHVTGKATGVEVRLRLDGELMDVAVAEHVPVHYGVEHMGELIVKAVRDASAKAAVRREQLGNDVTFFGQPARETARALMSDPRAGMDDLTAVRYW
jgi:DNA-binding protein YbaB